MSSTDSPSTPSQADAALPEHLPPVEPPSASFIVQLFLVPAIIVAVVIGLYVLFGKLAAGDTDWRQLVSDIKSDNPNVRWRAALNLAEGLDSDEARGLEGQHLASIPEIATALNDLTLQQLKSTVRNDEQQQQLAFLLKALGRMDAVDQIRPALRTTLDETQEGEIRKQSLQAIAMIAGRRQAKGESLSDPELVDAVIAASQSPDPVLRQHAAFALGLIGGPIGESRLGELLEDPDEMTRMNAAIGFARAGSPRGLGVFQLVLKQSADWPAQANSPREIEAAFEKQLMLRNALQAIEQIGPKLTPADRTDLAAQLAQLESTLPDQALRLRAKEVRIGLEKASPPTAERGT
ncbi:HEAT repeat protein [Caulifigura coniformis]|uniref:HEAT repeat protein n=1 Tax=Caulifigura coniformis TaxID=2527983 RepID=A0A517S8E1_9PLAN|nr:HEAT repeat domain-containing protein [Caulifigura coniformis]QDT52389.1 HEAT repeat protein [Caulifigura coniformis]